MDDFTVDVGQSEVASCVAIGHALLVVTPLSKAEPEIATDLSIDPGLSLGGDLFEAS